MIREILSPESIQVGKSFKTKEEATVAAGKLLLDNGYIEEEYIDSMLKKLKKESYATFIGNGVAIPHGMLEGARYIKKTGISFIQVPEGVDWNGETAYIIVGIAGIGEEQVDILSALANEIEDEADAKHLQKMDTVREIYKTLTRTAVHFGAGNIGRGFVAPLLQKNRYNVLFVDSANEVVDKINTEKKYEIHSYRDNSTSEISIENISALHTDQEEELKIILNNALLITTSVGSNNLDSIASLLDKHIEKNQRINFISFENMYRASTYVFKKEKSLESKVRNYDVVVDKVVPIQEENNLNLIVEHFGSIVFDEKQYSHKLIDLDEVVIKGDYEREYTKKLWLLNGLHVCLAYYGLSKGVEYIHQIYENREHKDFVEKINSEYFEAYSLYSEEDDESIKMYQKKINKRFKEKMSKDQTVRVARNPREKFSKAERVQGPLQYLIEKDKDVSAIKVVLDLIFSQEFQEVEGFSKFKDNSLSDGRENFYSSFWGQNQLLSKYISKLGA